MTDSDLETDYTAVANGIDEVGAQNAQLFLATLCLALISERENSAQALIEQAKRLART